MRYQCIGTKLSKGDPPQGTQNRYTLHSTSSHRGRFRFIMLLRKLLHCVPKIRQIPPLFQSTTAFRERCTCCCCTCSCEAKGPKMERLCVVLHQLSKCAL